MKPWVPVTAIGLSVAVGALTILPWGTGIGEPSPVADAAPSPRPPLATLTPAPTAEATATATPTATPGPRERRRALKKLVGQKFVVSYRGQRTLPPSLLARVRRGEVGGVILFTDNVPASGERGIREMTQRLQRAAREGRNPPLLIATDQEGGAVRRMPGPPLESPAAMGRRGAAASGRAGRRTGRSLRQMGINVDLAPVADVPAGAGSFLATRAFSSRRSGLAFARGLQDRRVAATAKHYPGLGTTGAANTDLQRVVITTPRSTLDRERRNFVSHAKAGTRLIMVSNGIYQAYDADRPAVLSRRILDRLRADGFGGVVISDELRTPGLAPYGDAVPRLASNAGVDLLLYANSDGAVAYEQLLRDARAGRISRARLEQQVRRIIALKRWLSGVGEAR